MPSHDHSRFFLRAAVITSVICDAAFLFLLPVSYRDCYGHLALNLYKLKFHFHIPFNLTSTNTKVKNMLKTNDNATMSESDINKLCRIFTQHAQHNGPTSYDFSQLG